MSTFWIINQYASTPATGIGGRHWYFARELARRGHNVYLIAARWHHLLRDEEASSSAPFNEEVEGFNFIRLRTHHYTHAHDKRRLLNWILFGWRLAGLPKQLAVRPDAILYSSPSLFGSPAASRLAQRFGARFVFEVRDIWPLTLIEVGHKSPVNPFIRLMQRIEDQAYRNADKVVSNLPGAAAHMISRGMDPAKFSWIPNGFSFSDVANPLPLAHQVRETLPRDKFIIGYAGTMGLANALDTLLDAAERLRGQKDIAFVLVGKGREKLRLQAEAKARGLDNVAFLDPVPKAMVQSMLAEFDVCFIGWHESPLYRFGIAANKLFDYLYSGRPILHGFSGDHDPVSTYGAGLTVPADDPQALAGAILQLRAMPAEDRLRMGERGRRAALEHHEYGMLAGELENVFLS